MFPVQAVAVASFTVLFRNTQMAVFKSTTNEQFRILMPNAFYIRITWLEKWGKEEWQLRKMFLLKNK